MYSKSLRRITESEFSFYVKQVFYKNKQGVNINVNCRVKRSSFLLHNISLDCSKIFNKNTGIAVLQIV